VGADRAITPVINPGEVILALDLGWHSGWACCAPGYKPKWGTKIHKHDDSGQGFASVLDWTNELIDQFSPVLIGLEAPYVPRRSRPIKLGNGAKLGATVRESIPPNLAVLRVLLGLPAIVRAVCAKRDVQYLETDTPTVCRFFTGKVSWGGRDLKKQATLRMCQLYGFDVSSFDASDALAVLVYLEALAAPTASRARGVGPLFLTRG
jgi:hypothetical protein